MGGEALEKQRLKERRTGFQRFESEVIDNPFSTPAHSEGYATDVERFTVDAASLEKRTRDAKLERSQRVLGAHRKRVADREEHRLKNLEENLKRADERIENKRLDANRITKNDSGAPYDPITLCLNDGLDGQRQKHAEDKIRYRAKLRSLNLHQRGSSSFNPITGEPTQFAAKPEKPPTPSGLLD